MDAVDTSGGIETLVQRTADMVELTVHPSMYKYDSQKYIGQINIILFFFLRQY